MADEYSTSGDTSGGGTAVLDASPASSASESDSPTSVGTTSDAGEDSGVGSDHGLANEPLIPKSRFDEANTRYQRLKWAEAVDRQQVESLRAFDQRFNQDPIATYRWLGEQLAMRGYQLQGPQQTQPHVQQPQNPDTLPGPDYQYRDEQGNVQQFYSAGQLQKVVAFVENKIGQRVAPLEQHISTQQVQWRAQQDAQRMLADAETWPHFGEFKQAIWQEMANDGRISLETAYRKAVIPAIRDRERQALLAELREKPGATTASPSSAQPQGSEDLSKLPISQLFAREMRKRGLGK